MNRRERDERNSLIIGGIVSLIGGVAIYSLQPPGSGWWITLFGVIKIMPAWVLGVIFAVFGALSLLAGLFGYQEGGGK